MTRYAIYYAPAASDPLWAFGSSVLGYDAARGARVAFPDHQALRAAPLEAWTAEPRKYGFHATLKPPFALAAGVDEAALVAAMRAFAAAQAPVRRRPAARRGDRSLRRAEAAAPAPVSRASPMPASRRSTSFRACQRRRAGAAPAEPADAVADREPRPLGLSLRLRRFSLPYDPVGTAATGGSRALLGRDARSLRALCAPSSSSTGSLYSGRPRRRAPSPFSNGSLSPKQIERSALVFFEKRLDRELTKIGQGGAQSFVIPVPPGERLQPGGDIGRKPAL